MHHVAYTADGKTYRNVAALKLENSKPQVFELDFSAYPDAADNPLFGIRVAFGKGAGGEGGNARFDNFSVEGVPARRAVQLERIGEALGRAGAWDEGAQSLGGGWRRLAWFGDYVPMGGDGWIWHSKHGFLFVPASGTPQNIWMFTGDQGWLWTSSTQYPFLYRSDPASWLWYNGSSNPRWLMNMTAGRWESWP